jgi:hypothetical protein
MGNCFGRKMADGAIAGEYENRRCLAMRIGRDEHRRGSIFRPRCGFLPRKILLYALRLNLISPPVFFLEVQHTEMAQVFTGEHDELAQIDLLFGAWRRCRRLSEVCVEDDLYRFRCGVLSAVYRIAGDIFLRLAVLALWSCFRYK